MAGPPYNLSDDAERCQLVNNETSSSTSIEIQTQEDTPSAPTEWPSTDSIAAIIGSNGAVKELIKYDSISSTGGSSETLTVGTRGAGTTTAQSWSAGDTIIHPISTLLLDSIPEQIVTAQGEIIRGGSDGTPESLSPGSTDDVLTYNGTSVVWSAPPEGMTATERQVFNDQISAIARLQFEHSLTELGYDGGFFDIFRDESKIASKTDVTVSTLDGGDANGKAEIDQTGSTVFTNDDNTSISVSDYRGLKINPNNNINGLRLTIGANSSGFTDAYLTEDGGSILDSKDISNLSAGDTFDLFASLSSGTVYYAYIYGGGASYTVGRYNSPSFPYSSTDLDVPSSVIVGSLGDAETEITSNRDAFVDVTALFSVNSGNLTSTDKDLGFVPNTVVLSQDADIPADEDIQYVISDTAGTPNTVTVTQAEVDTEVDVSAFTTQTVNIKPELSSSDGNDTPTLRSYAAHFAS